MEVQALQSVNPEIRECSVGEVRYIQVWVQSLALVEVSSLEVEPAYHLTRKEID